MTLERKQRQGHRRKINQLLLAQARGSEEVEKEEEWENVTQRRMNRNKRNEKGRKEKKEHV
jgi:hypothetical protein